MRPCVGIPGLCPPLCQWKDIADGTYDLAWVKMANSAMDEMCYARDKMLAENPA